MTGKEIGASGFGDVGNPSRRTLSEIDPPTRELISQRKLKIRLAGRGFDDNARGGVRINYTGSLTEMDLLV